MSESNRKGVVIREGENKDDGWNRRSPRAPLGLSPTSFPSPFFIASSSIPLLQAGPDHDHRHDRQFEEIQTLRVRVRAVDMRGTRIIRVGRLHPRSDTIPSHRTAVGER